MWQISYFECRYFHVYTFSRIWENRQFCEDKNSRFYHNYALCFNIRRASTSYFFPTFSYFFKIFLFIPIFCSEIPIFSLIWNKTYRYLHFCSYMTIGATVEKFSAPTGASILNLHSVHIMVHYWSNSFATQGWCMHSSLMKHNICMYEKHICYPEMIWHQYINDWF